MKVEFWIDSSRGYKNTVMKNVEKAEIESEMEDWIESQRRFMGNGVSFRSGWKIVMRNIRISDFDKVGGNLTFCIDDGSGLDFVKFSFVEIEEMNKQYQERKLKEMK